MPLLLLALLCLASPAAASDCEVAARIAAREQGIPEQLMLAITLAETGRSIDGAQRAWPWAVHSMGQGHWFRSGAEAVKHVEAAIAGGTSNIDIGCFQLNIRWHRAGFTTLDQMFEPLANARYAARFLAGLQQEAGSWEAATGLYHSRTPTLAERYRARVAAILTGPGTPATQALVTAAPRGQRITPARPLRSSASPAPGGARGSLISLHAGARPIAAGPRAALIGG